MKTSENTESTIQLGKSRIEVDDNSRAKRNDKYKLGGSEIYGGMIDISKVRNNKVAKKEDYQKMSKPKKLVRSSDFFTSRARLAFTKLRQVFVKVLILNHYDPEYYIWIEIDTLGYTIGEVLS